MICFKSVSRAGGQETWHRAPYGEVTGRGRGCQGRLPRNARHGNRGRLETGLLSTRECLVSLPDFMSSKLKNPAPIPEALIRRRCARSFILKSENQERETRETPSLVNNQRPTPNNQRSTEAAGAQGLRSLQAVRPGAPRGRNFRRHPQTRKRRSVRARSEVGQRRPRRAAGQWVGA